MKTDDIFIEWDRIDNTLLIDSAQDYDVYTARLSLQQVRDLVDKLVDIQQFMEVRQEQIDEKIVNKKVITAMKNKRKSEQTVEEVLKEIEELKK